MNRRGFIGRLLALAAAPFAKTKNSALPAGRYLIGPRTDIINDDVAAAMRYKKGDCFYVEKQWRYVGKSSKAVGQTE